MSSTAGDGSEPDDGAESGSPGPRETDSDMSRNDGEQDERTDQAVEDDQANRENSFTGPTSTWLKYTAEERNLAASLDQQRANDLATHLYNVHSLKARLRDPQLAAATKPWESKQRWISRDENGKLPWLPDQRWTAWPLPAEDVPRKGEDFGSDALLNDDDQTYRKAQPWRPSGDLEEELLAIMLKQAKQRFRQRSWASGPERPHRVDVGSLPTVSGSSQLQAEEGTDTDEAKPATFAQALPASDTPHFLEDDDEARAILKPTIRHIIAKFDDLLLGLQKSRAGHRNQTSTLKSRSRSKPSASRSNTRSQTPAARGRSRKRRASSALSEVEASDGSATDDPPNMDEETEQGAPDGDKRRRSVGVAKSDLGLRDWSEVLGMAALVGWDKSVVERTARRCASLFGEGMTFRVMAETAAGMARDEVTVYKPDMVPPLSDEDSDDDDDMAAFCPFGNCPNRNLDKSWRWREHLKRKHGLSTQQIAEFEGSRESGIEMENNNGADGTAVDADADKLDEAAESPELGSSEEADELSEMVGAVHNDGFLRPITGRIGRGPTLRATQSHG
ncbi:hypothetical protein BAUCODRAFT_36047 [Baudoinia panamericana UAMH 10762]|uniref:Rrn9 domain-containing protein n=1 Tax=Baudoinia panamericana (strain UAMH 10762) TaxID=717646 RepID=M2N7K5_BAUPA|nr:uncharacterized protein BAUCODRAFT_36047 [Baudoinia panamericana UAMH 10762]EMC94790.1 hypothetical protein BAUCODRAFT_36047 [Baudoinia panamericana UAMH 10762]